MNPAFEGLQPTRPLQYFSDILCIPRKSHQEDEIVAYIRNWAISRGYTSKVDEHKNLVVFVPATPGFEHAPTLCIQAHTDMVTVPDDITWPIVVEVDDDWVMVKDDASTLGADNGLGIAMALALCEEEHGPLELAFTSDEEDDFSGCEKFRKGFFGMKAKVGLNLDTPHHERITVASAGFVYLKSLLKLQREGGVGKRFKLELQGMPGGHSGENVHEFRGNSLKLMGKILARLPEGSRLVSLEGGEKGNSIPMGCTAIVQIPDDDTWREIVLGLVDAERETLRCPDMWLAITLSDATLLPLTLGCHQNIVSLLRTVPNGVVQMNDTLEDLPDLSSTPSLVKPQGDDALLFTHQVRGATEGLIDWMKNRLQTLYASHGCDVTIGHRGRSWMQNPGHPIVQALQLAYGQTGSPAMLSGNHGAIEPGTLCGDPANPQFEAFVSCGCWIRDEHRTTERFSLSSLLRTFKAVCRFVSNIARNGL